jgi:hypothetical protein
MRQTLVRGGLGAVVVAIGLVLFGSVAGAEPVLPTCGGRTADDQPAPDVATVASPTDPKVLDLGSAGGGIRRAEVEFVMSECMPLNPPVDLAPLASVDDDIPADAVDLDTEIVGNIVRVTLTVHRGRVEGGEYNGVLRVGDGTTAYGTAPITIKRQQPLMGWPLVAGFVAIVGGIALGGIKNLYGPGRSLSFSAGKRKDLKRRKPETTGDWIRYVLLRLFWTVAHAVETVARAAAHALGQIFTVRNIWAVLVGAGAGITAFGAAYVNDPTWHASINSVITLASKVGGAALVASLAAWQPTTPDTVEAVATATTTVRASGTTKKA